MDVPSIMVHVLSVDHDEEAEIATIRGTIRYGDPTPGTVLFFEDEDGSEYSVEVVDRSDQRRQVQLVVKGKDLSGLVGGRYCFGRNT